VHFAGRWLRQQTVRARPGLCDAIRAPSITCKTRSTAKVAMSAAPAHCPEDLRVDLNPPFAKYDYGVRTPRTAMCFLKDSRMRPSR
jgi:hypothetical protein